MGLPAHSGECLIAAISYLFPVFGQKTHTFVLLIKKVISVYLDHIVKNLFEISFQILLLVSFHSFLFQDVALSSDANVRAFFLELSFLLRKKGK